MYSPRLPYSIRIPLARTHQSGTRLEEHPGAMATKPEEAFYESLGIGRPSPQDIVDFATRKSILGSTSNV
jgi:hypothetical protein